MHTHEGFMVKKVKGGKVGSQGGFGLEYAPIYHHKILMNALYMYHNQTLMGNKMLP
jgi:hypothetical protein